ncbi:Omp28-related outer membrane protein [Rasiella rasia]|uniref:Omp28-related outer membrane protein n=1 Tax=Rasiella rasia TaxID=2744027 RepID=A0A6G6GRU7_9FLAO|nr:Omp28-related outer membrane protein [Rasiella rasia]QIE60431.1 Omp28-related outer membrane protein [Rasiella rasia]
MKLKSFYLALLAAIVLIGCSKSEDFSSFNEDDTVPEIEIGLVYRPASLRNQEIVFSVFDEDGTNITDGAVFYVNDAALSDNTFSSDTEGTFEIYAEYDDNGTNVVTDTENFSVVIPKRKVVIEDHTGTWCGYCPRITEAIERVYDETNLVSVVAIHNNDEMAVDFEGLLRDEFEVFGFPTGRINRTSNWSPPYQAEDVTSMAGEVSPVGIGIDSSIDGNTLSATISVSSEEGLTAKKLVVYLVESGIIADQTNYLNNDTNSQYFGQGDPIEDFVHDHVLRASLTDIFGNAITSTAALEEYTTTLTANVPADYDVSKLELVVMVTEEDNSAVNSQHAKVNEVKAYE